MSDTGRPFQSFCSSSCCSTSDNLSLQCFFDTACTKPVLHLCIPLEVNEMLLLNGRSQDSDRERPVNTVKSQKKLYQLQFALCMETPAILRWNKMGFAQRRKKMGFFILSSFSCWKTLQEQNFMFYSLYWLWIVALEPQQQSYRQPGSRRCPVEAYPHIGELMTSSSLSSSSPIIRQRDTTAPVPQQCQTSSNHQLPTGTGKTGSKRMVTEE